MYKLTILFLVNTFFILNLFSSPLIIKAGYDKRIPLGHIELDSYESSRGYLDKTLPLFNKINRETSQYQNYLLQLIGDTSCGENYAVYALNVEDAFIEEGMDAKNIQVEYKRLKEKPSACNISRGVDVVLYLQKKINHDQDGDGIVDSLDKCPNSSPKSVVSSDGCIHKTFVVLLLGRKKHTAIIVKTKKGALKIDKPFELVSLNSDEKISHPVKIDKKSLQKLMGTSLQASEQKQYKYIFYFNQLRLTEQSKETLHQMLQQLEKLHNPYINITGNTDTRGTVEQNKKLGLQRAKIIAKIIQHAGIKYVHMDISSNSELDLAKPTADDVAEPLNRRVEVLIQ